jgi:hypothetical protein
MKVDKFEKMKFRKLEAKFTDNRELYTAYIEGKFTRKDVLEKLETLAKIFRENGKNVYLGVSAHYAYPQDWLPAIYKSVYKNQVLFNPTDSPTTTEYKDINGLYFYVVEMPDETILTQKMHKLQKSNTNVENMFTKHKK